MSAVQRFPDRNHDVVGRDTWSLRFQCGLCSPTFDPKHSMRLIISDEKCQRDTHVPRVMRHLLENITRQCTTDPVGAFAPRSDSVAHSRRGSSDGFIPDIRARHPARSFGTACATNSRKRSRSASLSTV